jgi:hypothetical protein
MGTYLVTGIVQNIVVSKKDPVKYEITIDNIIERLKKEINIEYYIYNEDLEDHCWKINPKILEGNLAEFLDTQSQMYTGSTIVDCVKVMITN